MLRALSLVDVLAQLQSDSSTDIAYDPNEVINALTATAETLIAGSEALSATTTTNYPINLIQDAGPIAYWRLDDPLASTTVYDSNPWATATYPKLTGTVTGTVTFQASGAMTGSKGATFNGSSYIEFASTASLQRVGDLTLELWFKTTSLAATQTLISKGATGEFCLTVGTNGSVTFQMGASFSATVVPAASISTGNWYHLVFTRRAIDKTLACYLNGTSVYTGSYASAPSSTGNMVRLGCAVVTTGSFFVGTLDEVAIYARPLTAAQAANHYAWATATDQSAAGYGVAKYGYTFYPLPGPAAGAIYGDASTTYGGATYA